MAFVLKNFSPQKEKIILLSQNLGKIEIIKDKFNKNKNETILSSGILISFNPIKSKINSYIANNIDVLMVPIMYEKLEDLEWIHSLLEICYFFLPLDEPCKNIFTTMYKSFFFLEFNKNFSECFQPIKKLLTLKLLKQLGFEIHKDLSPIKTKFEGLVSTFIDFPNLENIESLKMFIRTLDNCDVNLLNLWILSCLKQHPNSNAFKTTKIFRI